MKKYIIAIHNLEHLNLVEGKLYELGFRWQSGRKDKTMPKKPLSDTFYSLIQLNAEAPWIINSSSLFRNHYLDKGFTLLSTDDLFQMTRADFEESIKLKFGELNCEVSSEKIQIGDYSLAPDQVKELNDIYQEKFQNENRDA